MSVRVIVGPGTGAFLLCDGPRLARPPRPRNSPRIASATAAMPKAMPGTRTSGSGIGQAQADHAAVKMAIMKIPIRSIPMGTF